MSLARAIANAVPTGVVLPFAGAAAPNGWLLCHGQAVSRATFAGLFAAISTTFGAGDGSTTFNLPDLRGRVAAGKDDMGGSAANRLTTGGSGVNGAALGAAGGAQTHTLSAAQMPSHNHGVNDPGHGHSVGYAVSAGAGSVQRAGPTDVINNPAPTSSVATGITIQNSGSDGAHNNTQPTLVLNHIIKA